ncbi:MAG TPA: TetR/AcrR family transcriptional regulator [Bryobacteraceae bacterium]|jgi:AcrR family transcriptional regulator|nr:TetR/AcrR family transcriptional regulator [Bryobacteraceae bacterium]
MVEKSGEYVDPRVRRTRQLLGRALDKLLKKKDFNDISIQDITGEATVNRATFYDHYPDKFALLTCMIACEFHELIAEREIQFEGTCAGELRAIVKAVCDYLVRMQGMDCKRQLEPHMESAIITAVREILLSGIRLHLPESAIAPEIVAASASWAIYGAAKEWAQTPDRCAPEEIVDAVTMLVSPVLQIPSK